MKHLIYFICSIQIFFGFKLQAQGQIKQPFVKSDAKTDFIEQQGYLSSSSLKDYTSFYGDSLKGFNESEAKAKGLSKGFQGIEFIGYIKHLKREFIIQKYKLRQEQPLIQAASSKLIGGVNTINVAPCVNEGFELNAPGSYTSAGSVTGWTISSRTADGQCSPTSWNAGSSEFSLVATPIVNFGAIGTIPHSPLGGTVVAQLNNTSPNFNTTRLSQSFPVTSANAFFQFAYAGFWQDGNAGHGCCDQALFKLLVKDCNGNLLACPTLSLNPYTSGCTSGLTTYTVTSGADSWCNWLVRSVDLTPFIGSCVTIEAIGSDCDGGAHYGVTFFDSNCGNQYSPSVNAGFGNSLGSPVNMCAGSSYATIQAPLGYASYSWTPPASGPSLTAAQSTLSALSLTNATVGASYTVVMLSYSGCQFNAVYTLSNTNVGLSTIGSSPTCSLGTSGSATVIGTGSGSGYTYSWVNSANFIVSTSSVISGLSQGNYSVTIGAVGSPGCGSATGTVFISTGPPSVSYLTKTYCGTEAYLSTSGGSNFQWYYNLSPISATLGGTASSYTASVFTNTVYWLSYTTNQGCKDSIRFGLVPTLYGAVTASNTQFGCNNGVGGGIAVISVTPAVGSPFGFNSFQVTSIGNTPTYSSAVNPTTSNSYTVTGLSANGNYMVNIFDGSCKYTTSFFVGTLPAFGFTLTPSVSQTVCNSNPILASVVLPSSVTPSQYTYSWSPSTFLFANNPTLQQTIITPTNTPGSVSTIIYTVAVTPTLINCPQTQTLSITLANLLPPTINPVSQLCTYSPVYTISTNPSGGVFSNNSAVSSTGLITPALASPGPNSFTYAVSVGTCVAKTSGSFNVGTPPTLTISGNSSFCKGQSTTLLAGGANTYSWSNSAQSPFITVSPLANTSYSVIGFSAITSCSNTANITVTVLSSPDIFISGDSLICQGKSTTLTASGANSYAWNTGASNPAIIVAPVLTTTYSVQGANTLGTCFGTQTITIHVIDCTVDETGIAEWFSDGGLIIYPNPGNGKITLETKYDITISVHDAMGRILLNEELQKGNYAVDLSNYAGGIYVLKTTYNGKTKITKLVKNN